MTRDEFYDRVLSWNGIPYRWGGQSKLEGVDCSGLLVLILEDARIIPERDFSAEALYRFGKNQGWKEEAGWGAVAFFGVSDRMTHCGWCVDHKVMINSSGGGPHTKSLASARKNNASVKIEPISRRHDLKAILMPAYQFL